MNHPIYRVRSFEIVGAYVLRIAFDDGTAQTIDFEPVLAGELFGPLRDPTLFRQVRAQLDGRRAPLRLRPGSAAPARASA